MIAELRNNPDLRWGLILAFIVIFFSFKVLKADEAKNEASPEKTTAAARPFKKMLGYRSYEHEDGKMSYEEVVIHGEEGEFYFVRYENDKKNRPLRKVPKSVISTGIHPKRRVVPYYGNPSIQSRRSIERNRINE